MAQSWAFVVTGLDDLEEVAKYATRVKAVAAQAINKTVRDYREIGAELIMQEVNFPNGYLDPSGRRFYVGKRARQGDLEGSIKARSRPTSLARFVTGGGGRGQGATVEVKQGSPKTIKKAFLIPLRAGSGIDSKRNMGLAIRLKPGETIRNKKQAIKLRSGLYLLYGPSVDQVFLQASGQKGVAVDMAPDIRRDLADTFIRMLEED
jgi:hypothetical protein